MAAPSDEKWRLKLNSFAFFRPPVVLAVFTLVNFLTFLDRGSLAGALVNIRTDPKIAGGEGQLLSQTEAGLLTSIFMAVFTISSPTFTALGGSLSTKTIILIGTVCWFFAVLATSFAQNFGVLLVARAVVGIGEAAFFPYFIVQIESMAPPEKKNLWLGIWYSMLPIGTAAGLAYGQMIAKNVTFGGADFPGWRVAFVMLMIPYFFCILFLAFLPNDYEVHRKDEDDVDEETETKSQFEIQEAVEHAEQLEFSHNQNLASPTTTTVKKKTTSSHVPIQIAIPRLFRNADFLLLCLATAGYDFILSGVAAWIINAVRQGPFVVSVDLASIIIGVVMMFSGLFGTLAVGWIADRTGSGRPGAEGVYRASFLCALLAAISCPVAVAGVLSREAVPFFVFFSLGVLFIIGIHPPVTTAILKSVDYDLRSYAVSVNMFVLHLLGDFPSPLVIGMLADRFGGTCASYKTLETCLDLVPVNYTDDNNVTSFNTSSLNNNSSRNEKDFESFIVNDCRWIVADQPGQTSFCSNDMQLNNAIACSLFAFAVLIPSLILVGWRKRREFLALLTNEHNKINGGDDEEGLLQEMN